MCSYCTTQLKSIHLRQHQIQNENCRPLFLRFPDQVGSALRTPHAKTSHVKMVHDETGDVVFIFNQNHEFFGLFSHRVDWV